ncbi:unnamed protein product [Rotaria magnacalcarata]|uniref:Uncharacterized protein n=3 Tax=Rotaria magnacalcarata TaxID=392030 RepID=A0A815GII1_9BILA|nr:unnamed protein product [Rotaria magnacalcarata]CAF1641832.1 unnamed protein product [Rotaria magnacalcarata]CAF4589928.1 unnamed protein product [Rotaria magnacalcarata]
MHVAVGDINNDNKVDIVVANTGANNIGVFMEIGDRTLNSMKPYTTGNQSLPIYVVLANFNHDPYLDVAFANTGADTVGIFFGYDNGNFRNVSTYSIKSGSQAYRLAIGDFNNDNFVDTIVAIYASHMVAFFSALGYFNDDNYLEIAIANYGLNNVGILFRYGDSRFTEQVIFSTGDGSRPSSIVVVKTTNSTGDGSGPKSVAAADFNKDRQLDMTVANFDGDNIGIYFGNGNGVFANEPVLCSAGNGSHSNCVAVSDFNNDNRSDIVIGNYRSNGIRIFFGHENETFLNYQPYSTGYGSRLRSVAVGYFNHDDWIDLTVTMTVSTLLCKLASFSLF